MKKLFEVAGKHSELVNEMVKKMEDQVFMLADSYVKGN
jgi:hypothetical protein